MILLAGHILDALPAAAITAIWGGRRRDSLDMSTSVDGIKVKSTGMVDPAFLRDNLETVRTALQNRGLDLTKELEELAALEADRRRLLPEVEGLKREQNSAAEEVGKAKRQGLDITVIQEQSRERNQRIKQLSAELEAIETRRNRGLLMIPNLPHATVPVGKSAAENVEVRRIGTPRQFAFTPQAHWDLGPALGIIDFERGTKIAAARFSVLIGAGAKLARALINFMLSLHTREHGYTEVEPPFMANTASLTGTGNLPKFEADLFKIAGGDWDLYLIPTAEVPLTNMYRGEILEGRQLPIRYTAYTPCFRSEAGSYGADVRGLIRQHQFDKVELMVFTTPDDSFNELERLTGNAEEVLKRLELPYRTMLLSTGDMGFASAKTYDIEVWLPGQSTYREISSCSNTEAFQARRANIKYRATGGGKPDFVHTLNGSGLAVGRTLIAVLENCQQEDGSVVVPEALRPFMDGLEVIKRT
jgi:seryl-tRNA synthetase